MNYLEAVKYLKTLHGVGDKVANCIALFGMYKIEAFPIDVWIKRILETRYHNDFLLKRWNLQDIGGIVQGAGPEVHGIQGFRADAFGPLQIFIVSHIIGDKLVPGQVQVRFPLLTGTNGILPVPSGDKIAAGQPDRRQAGTAQAVHEVLPQTQIIRGGMLWVVHAAVDHGTDRFQKGTEQPGRDGTDPEGWMHGHF